MISTDKPDGFKPIYDVASCFVERTDGKILLLLRLAEKSEGNKWGVPAGKVEAGETPLQTVAREIWEETGIRPRLESLRHFQTYYVRYPDYDFVYDVFHLAVPANTQGKINPVEHQALRWSSPQNALDLDLVRDQDNCIKFFYFPTHK